jgi:hypothetical protein
MIILFSIKQTGQYLGTLDVGFLCPFRPAGKQYDDLPAALCEIDAPPRAQMYAQFRYTIAYGRNISRSNRLIRATTTPRTISSLRPSIQAVNPGRGRIENTFQL